MKSLRSSPYATGIIIALSTPLLLGVAPIFGKQAISARRRPVQRRRRAHPDRRRPAVDRSSRCFLRKSIFIYPAGLLGCVVVGVVNGIGSLFYYSGLGLLDASLAQLLNGMYLVFAVLLSHLGGEKIDRRVMIRVALAVGALMMLTGFGSEPINWLGVGLMLGNALDVRRDGHPQPVRALRDAADDSDALHPHDDGHRRGDGLGGGRQAGQQPMLEAAFPPTAGLGITTALSRLAMFASVSVFGSLRTAIMAVARNRRRAGAGVLHARRPLKRRSGDRRGLLVVSMLLIRSTDLLPHGFNPNVMLIHDMANLQFQRIAFHRAFGKTEHDNEYGVMSTLTTAELLAIQKMLGANNKPVDPFPLNKCGGYSVDLTGFLNEQEDTNTAPKQSPSGDSDRTKQQRTDTARGHDRNSKEKRLHLPGRIIASSSDGELRQRAPSTPESSRA